MFHRSLTSLVGIMSGLAAAPFGDALRAFWMSLHSILCSVGCMITCLSLGCSLLYRDSWSPVPMWSYSAAMVLSFFWRAVIGCLVAFSFTVLKHSGSVSSSQVSLLAMSLA